MSQTYTSTVSHTYASRVSHAYTSRVSHWHMLKHTVHRLNSVVWCSFASAVLAAQRWCGEKPLHEKALQEDTWSLRVRVHDLVCPYACRYVCFYLSTHTETSTYTGIQTKRQAHKTVDASSWFQDMQTKHTQAFSSGSSPMASMSQIINLQSLEHETRRLKHTHVTSRGHHVTASCHDLLDHVTVS